MLPAMYVLVAVVPPHCVARMHVLVSVVSPIVLPAVYVLVGVEAPHCVEFYACTCC